MPEGTIEESRKLTVEEMVQRYYELQNQKREFERDRRKLTQAEQQQLSLHLPMVTITFGER